jgi:hypothetical protein
MGSGPRPTTYCPEENTYKFQCLCRRWYNGNGISHCDRLYQFHDGLFEDPLVAAEDSCDPCLDVIIA